MIVRPVICFKLTDQGPRGAGGADARSDERVTLRSGVIRHLMSAKRRSAPRADRCGARRVRGAPILAGQDFRFRG